MGCCLVSHRWKYPKVLVGLMVLELLDTVATLALFGVAQPDQYRTAMWQIGSDNGFNSSPDQVLYAYANYQPIPTTPMVWSSFITEWNVVITVFTMFLLLAKATMFIMHIWVPILSILVNIVLISLWTLSAYGQAGPDYSDPEHPSSVAWYIAKSCDYARPSGNYGNCIQAKASFAATIFMLFILTINLGWATWSSIPTKEQKKKRREQRDVQRILADSPNSENPEEKLWEMNNVPRTPRTPTAARQPFTPRTLAFNTLDRKLPLREASA